MRAYHDLCRLVLDAGTDKPTRAVLPSTGQRVAARSIFGAQARFDLRAGFPAVTTKRLPWRGVVAELLWFLSGSDNLAALDPAARKWWEPWAQPDGWVPHVYGDMWRSFGPRSVDQIARLMADLRAVRDHPEHPAGRRMILTAWNPEAEPALPACHTLSQWSVTDGRLSCHLYQRSADLLLGVPVNVASYALLTHLLARCVGLEVGDLIVSYGDLHVYANHLDTVREMLRREPLPLPALRMPRYVVERGGDLLTFGGDGLRPMRVDDFALVGYQHHGALTGEMAV